MISAADLNWPAWIVITAFGAAVGSFLNVVIYRLPQRQSLIWPPSHCMSCGRRLRPIDLIPVLSYLLLRGRCRYCGKPFSPRYALVELACGLLAAGAVYSFGLTAYAAGVFVCLCALLVVMFVDIDHMIIPDEAVVVILIMGLVFDAYRVLTAGASELISFSERFGSPAELVYTVYLPRSIVGLLVGGGLFLFITWFFTSLMHKPVMGMGDVKLAAAMGAVLGPGYQFIVYFLLCILIGAAISVLLIALRIRSRQDYIPFGPMMAVAGIVMLLAGAQVTPYVLQFYRL